MSMVTDEQLKEQASNVLRSLNIILMTAWIIMLVWAGGQLADVLVRAVKKMLAVAQ